MIHFVISGTIDGEFDFPNEMFAGFCYESWGNVWAMIDGVEAKYIPAKTLIHEPSRFNHFDILMAEHGQRELFAEASKHSFFKIATQSGAGFDLDREPSFEAKQSFIRRLSQCDLFLSTTFGGKDYLSLFTQTPVLDIPLPLDTDQFRPRHVRKFDEFTVCLGELIESCYDDRPLQYEAVAICNSLGIPVVASIAPHSKISKEQIRELGLDVLFYDHKGLYPMSVDYLAKSHVSMMLGQRSTFGRFVYASWAIGVPCIATRYQCQEKICPELTVSHEEVALIRSLLEKLRSDPMFYNLCRNRGLRNVRQFMANEVIALRILNEILPIYLNWRNQNA